MMCKDWNTSYNILLEELDMTTLENRRKYHRLVFFYKLVNGMLDTGSKRYTRVYRIGRTDHNLKMYVPFARTDYYKNSFYPKTTNEWNKLPNAIVTMKSLGSFKNALMKHLIDQG